MCVFQVKLCYILRLVTYGNDRKKYFHSIAYCLMFVIMCNPYQHKCVSPFRPIDNPQEVFLLNNPQSVISGQTTYYMQEILERMDATLEFSI